MPIIPVICTQCGAKLELDSEAESGFCPFCDTPFIIERKKDNLKSEADNLAKAGNTFLSLKEYISAREKFKLLSNKFPYDYRGWWGLVKTDSKNFADIGISKRQLNDMYVFYNKASAVASAQKKQEIKLQFEKYVFDVRNELARTEKTVHSRIEQLNKEHEYNRSVLSGRINALDRQRENRRRLPMLVAVFVVVFLCIVFFISNGGVLDISWLLAVFLLACAVAYIIFRVMCAKTGSEVKKINGEIRLLQNQLADENKRYSNEMNSLNEQIAKSVND